MRAIIYTNPYRIMSHNGLFNKNADLHNSLAFNTALNVKLSNHPSRPVLARLYKTCVTTLRNSNLTIRLTRKTPLPIHCILENVFSKEFILFNYTYFLVLTLYFLFIFTWLSNSSISLLVNYLLKIIIYKMQNVISNVPPTTWAWGLWWWICSPNPLFRLLN